MRSGSEDQCLLEPSKSEDDFPQFHKVSTISYTRSFLLSLSELDTCKRLPCGLDQSIIGEIQDLRTGLLQPFYGSDSRRFHGSLSRHSYPDPEHGLLGSGAFPRVSSCISGASASLVQGNSYHLLNKTNAAYQPPHRCKAKVRSRTESEELYNNETFGSSENLTQGRAEEERMRKDSFEMMRKEQHKTFQEKQNKTCDEYKENLDPEIAEPLEASGNYRKTVNKYNESDEHVASLSPANDSVGLDFTAQTSAGKLLPPDNKSRSLEMNFETESLINSFILEPCDVRRNHGEGYRFRSSDFAHQFLEENKPAGSMPSNYVKGDTFLNEKVFKDNFTNLSSGRNEHGVLTTEGFEVSMLSSQLNEHYSTQHHPVKGWSPYDTKCSQLNSAAEHGASQHLLSFIEKEPGQTCSAKDSQTTDFPGIHADSFSMVTSNDVLKPHRFLFPASGNNNTIHLAVDESGSIEINCDGSISKICSKQTAVCKIEESLSISDDIQTKIGFNLGSESQSKLSPVSGFHESADSIDEICLPDEDSLITVDDFIVPQDSTFLADGNSVKSDLCTVNYQINNADKLEALNLALGDEISTQLALDGPIFDSYDVKGLKTSYQSLHSHQSFPQFGQYQINPGRAFFKSSDAREVQMSQKMRSLGSQTYLYNPQPLHHFPANVLSDHFKHPHIDLRRLGHPINSPLLQQMPTPSKSSLHQVHELPRGSPSPHLSNETTCYTQELLHATQNFPLYYGQQYYKGLEMPIADHIAGGISDKEASNRLCEMEVRSRPIHHLAVAGHSSDILGEQVDMGFWYGK